MKHVILIVVAAVMLIVIGYRLGKSTVELSCLNYEAFSNRGDVYLCKRVPPEMLKPKSQFNREA